MVSIKTGKCVTCSKLNDCTDRDDEVVECGFYTRLRKDDNKAR